MSFMLRRSLTQAAVLAKDKPGAGRRVPSPTALGPCVAEGSNIEAIRNCRYCCGAGVAGCAAGAGVCGAGVAGVMLESGVAASGFLFLSVRRVLSPVVAVC